MQPHDLSVGGDVLDRVTRCARQAVSRYGCHPAATVTLLNVSENATYLVEDPDQGLSVLRAHRLGYHTGLEIESELAWMDALRAEAGVRTPRVLPAPDGRRVMSVTDPASGERRDCVRFEYLPGSEPADSDLTHFAALGALAGWDRSWPGRACGARAAGRHAQGPARRLWQRPGAVRPGARGHPSGQPHRR